MSNKMEKYLCTTSKIWGLSSSQLISCKAICSGQAGRTVSDVFTTEFPGTAINLVLDKQFTQLMCVTHNNYQVTP